MTQDKKLSIEDVLKKHLPNMQQHFKDKFPEIYMSLLKSMQDWAAIKLSEQSCSGWVKATGQSKDDGWFYDTDFLRTITEKVNEQDWGEGLCMEQVEAVLKVAETINKPGDELL